MRPPQTAPDHLKLLASEPERIFKAISANMAPVDSKGRYLHWDALRRHPPPDGLDVEEWWAATRFARSRISTPVLAFQKMYGVPFSFANLSRLRRALHRFDRRNTAKELILELSKDGDAVDEYRMRQIIEEAISSSEIEGAKPTTRELARQLLREKDPPASKSERMIVNNWSAMHQIVKWNEEGRKLVLEDFLELHRIIGADALDVKEPCAGMLRNSEHQVGVFDNNGVAWHIPPPVVHPGKQLPPLEARIEALLSFAQETGEAEDDEAFIHPILRAMICHFWVGYEHPFRDGNGRMARALFYWVMLRNHYELAEFLSISGPIDRKPREYFKAFAYVETDQGDLTYFLLHQMGVLEEALDDLRRHIRMRTQKLAELSRFVAKQPSLNYRQRVLLQKAIKQPQQLFSVQGHSTSHGIHPNTARRDLRELVASKYLREKNVGKEKRYLASPQLLRIGKR